jgi:integrase
VLGLAAGAIDLLRKEDCPGDDDTAVNLAAMDYVMLNTTALALETLRGLKAMGKRDVLGLIAMGRLELADVHDAYTRNPEALTQLVAKATSPALGGLVDDWPAWQASPAGVSPKTKRRFSPTSIRRYRQSWNGFFATLPKGRDATLADLTSGFVADYKRSRVRATGGLKRKEVPGRELSGATLNRDLAALGAFLTYCRDVRGLSIATPKLSRERETRGRERWLSADELRAFEQACPPDWWPLFATLFRTGARLGEVMGLRGADVLLHAKRLTIHEGDHRVKSRSAIRDLPISSALLRPLAAHLARVSPGPADLLFAGEMQKYDAVRRTRRATCKAAGIAGATPHDARHTFAVHAAMSGVPIVRLQKLLGHAEAQMTMRYMQHAPEAYLDTDAERIAAQMDGTSDQESEARVQAARQSLTVA